MDELQAIVGRVQVIRRYPVKSMLGEELDAVAVTRQGVLGDRAYALVDVETGKVASAKNPKRWPRLFQLSAAYSAAIHEGTVLPAVRLILPDGSSVKSDDQEAEARLSATMGRPVRLAQSGLKHATAEGYWPDFEWLAQRDEVFEFAFPPGTFFDGAPVHLVTSATLERLSHLAPASQFDVARFRPNFVIQTTDGSSGFVEEKWAGRIIQLGASAGAVQLRVERPAPRCVMTTLAQGDLPKDPNVLRTAVCENGGNVGVYATVVQAGQVRRGDNVYLQ